jgi:hypothetical protein
MKISHYRQSNLILSAGIDRLPLRTKSDPYDSGVTRCHIRNTFLNNKP